MNETNLISLIKLAAVRIKARLWRNNSGATFDQTGRMIRYGLANESAKINQIFKMGDLVGIRSITITPDMVGRTVGIFMMREVKRPGWKYTNSPREQAQKNAIDFINALGGDAAFISDVNQL